MSYDIALVLGFSAISGVMGYLAMNVDRQQHGILQIFFIALSLFGQWGTLGAIRFIIEDQSKTGIKPMIDMFQTVWIWAVILFFFYVFIQFFWNLLKAKRNRKRGDQLLDYSKQREGV